MLDELFELFERDERRDGGHTRPGERSGVRGVFSRLFGRAHRDEEGRGSDDGRERRPHRDDDNEDDWNDRRRRERPGFDFD